MTETTTLLASRTYDKHLAGWLECCEYEAVPFTERELNTIDSYFPRINGIPDCFDGDGLGTFPAEFSEADKVDLIKSHFGMLDTWREAITILREELGDLSVAASRFVGRELGHWHQAREGWRSGTIEHFLGKDEFGYPYGSLYGGRIEGHRYFDGMFWIPA